MLARLKGLEISIFLVIVVVNAFRLTQLDVSPPGFYVDESINAANIICLREEGIDIKKNSWPLFAVAAPGGGFTTPPMSVLGVVWSSVFGDSISAFRALSAFVTILTIILMALFIGALFGSRAALWTALVGSLSPWAWIFSRISWDPPLMPFFFAAALALTVWVWSSQRRWLVLFGLAVASVLFSLSAYAYAPGRVVLPVFLPLFILASVFVLRWRWSAERLAAWVLPGVVLALPLVQFMRTPMGGLRAQVVGIMAPHTMERMGWTALELPIVLLKNMALHFSPSFLLVSGDQNLRHSVANAAVGLLSWFEAAILFVGLPSLVWLARSSAGETQWKQLRTSILFSGFLVLAGALFFLPAALTWESLPHALRSIGVWPLWTAAVGLIAAALIERVQGAGRMRAGPLAFGVALVSGAAWIPTTLRADGSKDLGLWFDEAIVRVAARTQAAGLDWKSFEAQADQMGPYLEEGRIYHRMVSGGMTCSEAISFREPVGHR
jgi:hypothetical protein